MYAAFIAMLHSFLAVIAQLAGQAMHASDSIRLRVAASGNAHSMVSAHYQLCRAIMLHTCISIREASCEAAQHTQGLNKTTPLYGLGVCMYQQ